MKKLGFIAFIAFFALPVFGQEAGIFLTNQDGTITNQFNIGDLIYLEGICPSAGGIIAKIYVMPDRDWTTGDQIYDVSGGIETLQVPSTAEMGRIKIWQGFVEGAFDVVIDTNNDQVLQSYEKCLIGETGTGFRVGNPAPPPSAPTPAPTPPPSPPPVPAPIIISPPPSQPAQSLSLDDNIEVKNLANVRKSPGGETLGQQSQGKRGIVVGGPVQAKLAGINYWYWNINFVDDPDGWVAEATIQLFSEPEPEKKIIQQETTVEPEKEPEIKVAEETSREEESSEKELAQISDTSGGFGMSSLLGSVVMGLAILFGLIIGSSIIARAIRRE